jgi:KamA family protein
MDQFVNLKLASDKPAIRQPFKVFTERNLEQIPQLQRLSPALIFDMKVVSQVLPFRVNEYVLNELIDWKNIPDDPIFQLLFPQPQMLSEEAFARVANLMVKGADTTELKRVVKEIRADLNPHPAGQMELNVPRMDAEPIPGLQHKYRETALFFPSQGQTCHSYCSFCFRWAQFVGDKDLRFASKEVGDLVQYLRSHPSISDVLFTGGDPMVMSASNLRRYLEPLLAPELDHVRNIRIGTKSLTFWPQRYVSDPDADDLLRLFDELVAAGKHVALMAHYNHWREMDTGVAQAAIRRVRETGVMLRSQGPLLRHINDDEHVWARMWSDQVSLGIVPYYMFVERDTGAKRYFEVPLARAHAIYRKAQEQTSGLGRTARGPSMSAGPGKVEVQGDTVINGEHVFALRFLQARDPSWVHRPFFARYDESATWLDDLKPAFGEAEFFFEPAFRKMQDGEVGPRHFQ